MSEALYAAEYVLPGHPDKLCDAIADALVQEARRQEQRALAAVEVAVHRASVFVTGRLACKGADGIDVERLVREVYRSAGYDERWLPDPEGLRIVTDLRREPLAEGEPEFRDYADDQAICVGYAVELPETNYLPAEHWLGWRLARRLQRLRVDQPALALGPDGKVIVGMNSTGSEHALERFSCSLHQEAGADPVALHRAVRLAIEEELSTCGLPGLVAKLPAELSVNGAGAFEVGGTEGDNGLSGKKLVVDAYGPRVPIGGGAWSGKDFFKADRAGALYARRLAKLLVMLGLAFEATVWVGWRPGAEACEILRVTGATLDQARRCARLLDPTLKGSGERWGEEPDLVEVARWGHFTETSRRWEAIAVN
ncbi:MAG: methionine adenosyltransferase domain-containing protein [Steroidobacteraceae bacterium]